MTRTSRWKISNNQIPSKQIDPPFIPTIYLIPVNRIKKKVVIAFLLKRAHSSLRSGLLPTALSSPHLTALSSPHLANALHHLPGPTPRHAGALDGRRRQKWHGESAARAAAAAVRQLRRAPRWLRGVQPAVPVLLRARRVRPVGGHAGAVGRVPSPAGARLRRPARLPLPVPVPAPAVRVAHAAAAAGGRVRRHRRAHGREQPALLLQLLVPTRVHLVAAAVHAAGLHARAGRRHRAPPAHLLQPQRRRAPHAQLRASRAPVVVGRAPRRREPGQLPRGPRRHARRRGALRRLPAGDGAGVPQGRVRRVPHGGGGAGGHAGRRDGPGGRRAGRGWRRVARGAGALGPLAGRVLGGGGRAGGHVAGLLHGHRRDGVPDVVAAQRRVHDRRAHRQRDRRRGRVPGPVRLGEGRGHSALHLGLLLLPVR
jgi:hypothetical protein